jgi:tetratricopeptide (TPR) repeat protein
MRKNQSWHLIALLIFAALFAGLRVRAAVPERIDLTALSDLDAAQDHNTQLAEAKRLNEEVARLWGEQRFGEAIPPARKALAIVQAVLGPKHPTVATYMNNLAMLHIVNGDYRQAEPLLTQALTIYEDAYGPKHLDVASALYHLGLLYERKGDYVPAERSFKRAILTFKELLGPVHADIIPSLNGLAQVYADKGEYTQAERAFEEALAMAKAALHPRDPTLASIMNNLGLLYKEKGDYQRSESWFKQAVTIMEGTYDPKRLGIATYLSNLAGLYEDNGDYERAEALFKQVLAIRQGALPPRHLDITTSLNNLATLYHAKNNLEQAESLYKQSLAIREGLLGPKHPDVAILLNNLARLYRAKGDIAQAEYLYKRLLLIREERLPPKHPETASTLVGLALLCEYKGEYAQAAQYLTRANEIREDNLRLILNTGSERQKQLYLDILTAETYVTISLHVRSASQDARAAQLALTTILRRKGRSLDAMTDQISALRRRAPAHDLALLDQLAAARSYLSTLQISGGGRWTPEARREEVTRLSAEVERLEGEVGRRSEEFRARDSAITLEAVRQIIPADASLVEIFLYLPLNAQAKNEADRWGEPRYVAYVARRDTAEPRWVDLGEAATIHAEVRRLRAALRNPANDVQTPARAVDELVMRPIRKLLGPRRHMVISPDGVLNLIPFAALVDENGKYLVEKYTLTYLTSGRDLLRLRDRAESRSAPLVIADPAYDMGTARSQSHIGQTIEHSSGEIDGRLSSDFPLPNFNPLPGTAEEAVALSKLWPDAGVLTKDKATEGALKQVRSPRILHIATHGFFLEDLRQEKVATGINASKIAKGGVARSRTAYGENPLLRSGLALAGANRLSGGGKEDGILTALEASGLNLRGTRIVTLSACETGLGEV